MEKQAFPENPPSIEVPIRLTLISDFEKYTNGTMLMRLSDTTVDVSNGKGKAGAIGMGLGGSFFVDVGEAVYLVKMDDLMGFFRKVKDIHEKG